MKQVSQRGMQIKSPFHIDSVGETTDSRETKGILTVVSLSMAALFISHIVVPRKHGEGISVHHIALISLNIQVPVFTHCFIYRFQPSPLISHSFHRHWLYLLRTSCFQASATSCSSSLFLCKPVPSIDYWLRLHSRFVQVSSSFHEVRSRVGQHSAVWVQMSHGYAERTFHKGWKVRPTGNRPNSVFLPE